MNTYDVRVNLGGVVSFKVKAEDEDKAVDMVMDTIENSTFKELHKHGELIKSVSKVKEINKNKEMER